MMLDYNVDKGNKLSTTMSRKISKQTLAGAKASQTKKSTRERESVCVCVHACMADPSKQEVYMKSYHMNLEE